MGYRKQRANPRRGRNRQYDERTQSRSNKGRTGGKKDEHIEIGVALKDEPIEKQIAIASISTLPNVDLHGYTTSEVEFEVDQLLSENPGDFVRIIYGGGTGVLGRAVMRYLHRLKGGKNPKIEGFRKDDRTHSVVVKVLE